MYSVLNNKVLFSLTNGSYFVQLEYSFVAPMRINHFYPVGFSPIQIDEIKTTLSILVYKGLV